MYSLYIHIPFCRSRCSYCDFNTYAGQEGLIGRYVEALKEELRRVAGAAPRALPVHTVYFGGGTPSLLAAKQVAEVLETVARRFSLAAGAEISLEANPGTVSPRWLREIRAAGVNRLSLGMQSAHPADLRLLERDHDFFAVVEAVKAARSAGFRNLNLDLIFGIPHQTMERWQQTLNLALGLEPEHLSLYALTLEHGTPLAHWVGRGLLPAPDADLAADMYEWADARLASAGFRQYEISNWAKEGFACRHNLQYWRSEPYLGFGAGAHGYAEHIRAVNVLTPAAYIRRMERADREYEFPRSPANVQARRLSPREEMEEFMMMGLRLTEEGVSAEKFAARFGVSLENAFGEPIARLVGLGLLERVGDRLRLTRRARLLGNVVFREFVGGA